MDLRFSLCSYSLGSKVREGEWVTQGFTETLEHHILFQGHQISCAATLVPLSTAFIFMNKLIMLHYCLHTFPDWQQISRIVGEWFCTQHLWWMLTQEQSKCRAQIRGFFFSHKLFLKQLCWSHTSLFAACSWTKFRDSISANYIWELQDVYKINCRTGCFYNAVLFSYHKHKVLFYWT